MGQLMRTTPAFLLNGTSRAGIPYLVDGDMRIISEPTEWILHLASRAGGAAYSNDTLVTYAEALDDFFETVSASGWLWDELTRDDIDDYVAKLRRTDSAHTGRALSVKTINLRVRVIALFYEWAVSSRKLSSSPVAFKAIKRPISFERDGSLAHIRGSREVEVNAHLIRDEVREPQALSPNTARTLLSALGSTYRLIGECALTSGARRFELATWHCDDWRNVHHISKSVVAVTPTEAKRGHRGPLYFPRSIYERVCRYIDEERPIVARRSATAHLETFLNRDGTPITRKLITQTFYRASQKTGSRASFHDLRHTFITRVAHELGKASKSDIGHFNAALVLKVLARHKSIRTTLIYTHSVKNDIEVLGLAIDEACTLWL